MKKKPKRKKGAKPMNAAALFATLETLHTKVDTLTQRVKRLTRRGRAASGGGVLPLPGFSQDEEE